MQYEPSGSPSNSHLFVVVRAGRDFVAIYKIAPGAAASPGYDIYLLDTT